jgi:hypothetical protein
MRIHADPDKDPDPKPWIKGRYFSAGSHSRTESMNSATGLNSRLLKLLSNFAFKYAYKNYYRRHNFRHIKDHSNIFVDLYIKK